MDDREFKKPDEAALKRMTPRSINALLSTLRQQRAEKVKKIDIEIKYYEDLYETKFTKVFGKGPKDA